MNNFDEHLIGVVDISDPTAPEHFRGRFESMLYESVKESIVITGNTVKVSIGDKNEMGYNGVTEDPMSTIVFIIEGILGDYAFLTKDIIQTRFKSHPYLGRYSGGYLVSKSYFYSKGWNNIVNWSDVRWGFSNKPPIDIFNINTVPVSDIISKTITKTCEEFSSILRSNQSNV